MPSSTAAPGVQNTGCSHSCILQSRSPWFGGSDLADASAVPSLLLMLYTLTVFLPSLGVSVRRLHDTGRNGWWIFLALVPFVGAIMVLVWMATEGDRRDNQYGPDPKAIRG